MLSTTSTYPAVRTRRLRQHGLLPLLAENTLTVNDLVATLFVAPSQNVSEPMSSLPGHHQYSVDKIDDEIKKIASLHIPAVMVFALAEKKDSMGSEVLQPTSVMAQAIAKIKTIAPNLLVMADLCFCAFTHHGHCGVLNDQQKLDNDLTLANLSKQALVLAKAGADVLAPSGMVDGTVCSLRKTLDEAGFTHVAILNHSAKYNSSIYASFRGIFDSAPKAGDNDRRHYYLNPSNRNEAIREILMDVNEGADMVMVKPAGPYQDVIYAVKQAVPYIPVFAYHVSGEYVMIKAAAEKKLIDEKKVTLEILTGIKRSGASGIVTYAAIDVAQWLADNPY